jgi:flavin-binding protein dodecin
MSESVYKVIELVGTSQANWEISAENAVYTASKSLKELRVAEISKLDMAVEDGTVTDYRARIIYLKHSIGFAVCKLTNSHIRTSAAGLQNE